MGTFQYFVNNAWCDPTADNILTVKTRLMEKSGRGYRGATYSMGVMRMADRIEAGTVYINNYLNAATQSPVGGFKQSGYGRKNGWEGMHCYRQTKSVWLATQPNQPDPFPT